MGPSSSLRPLFDLPTSVTMVRTLEYPSSDRNKDEAILSVFHFASNLLAETPTLGENDDAQSFTTETILFEEDDETDETSFYDDSTMSGYYYSSNEDDSTDRDSSFIDSLEDDDETTAMQTYADEQESSIDQQSFLTMETVIDPTITEPDAEPTILLDTTSDPSKRTVKCVTALFEKGSRKQNADEGSFGKHEMSNRTRKEKKSQSALDDRMKSAIENNNVTSETRSNEALNAQTEDESRDQPNEETGWTKAVSPTVESGEQTTSLWSSWLYSSSACPTIHHEMTTAKENTGDLALSAKRIEETQEERRDQPEEEAKTEAIASTNTPTEKANPSWAYFKSTLPPQDLQEVPSSAKVETVMSDESNNRDLLNRI